MKPRKRTYVGTTSPDITEREIQNGKAARHIAAEGFVLLKNENHTLPIPKGSHIGLYGGGAVKTIKGGTGSGDVNNRASVNIYQGLQNAGYGITAPSAAWLADYEACYDQARLDWKDEILRKEATLGGPMAFFDAYSTTPFMVPPGAAINEAAAKDDGAETTVYVLSRIAGENADRRDVPGDYYITQEEHAQIAALCRAYERVVLIINTGGLIDLAFTEEFPNLHAIIQYVQAGQEGGNALADVLSGDVTPSGKMTDTWALHYEDYPNADFFSFKSGDVYKEEYKEGIYVGYRYFDTFDVPVRYCFGYGLSYTEFSITCGKITVQSDCHVLTENSKISATEARTESTIFSDCGTLPADSEVSEKVFSQAQPTIQIETTVTNTGDTYSGKEVVQVYVSCPQGEGLAKEFRRLAGFAKTTLLAPGESQTLTISIPIDRLSSYCEDRAAWILDKGTYLIWLGNSLDNANLVGTITLDETAPLVRCEQICPLKETLEEIAPDSSALTAKEQAWKAYADENRLPEIVLHAADFTTQTVSYTDPTPEFPGKAGEIVEALSTEQLIALATGDPAGDQQNDTVALGSAGQTVPGAAAETSTIAADNPWGVASIVLADGPAGLRLRKTYQVREDGSIDGGTFLDGFENGFFSTPKEPTGTVYYQYCTAFPVGTLLAQSWDVNLMMEVGKIVGQEMTDFEVSLWLAPGMSLHRNPLCGRNFEYYSEDPLLSGMMATAITRGVQKNPGCGTTIKHFCCNNQEDNRMGSDSVISERALREIYLKNFEIAVMETQPMAIMTSYNLINGVHAANSYDICTKVARNEWGFEGVIMTDWTTTTNSTAGECTAAGCVRAGNDLTMPGTEGDHDSIRAALADGSLNLHDLKACVYRIVKLILQTNQYESAKSYHK